MSPDLEAELHDLIARRDIEKVLQRYMRAQDRLLSDLHLSAFHEDAYVDCGLFKGSAKGFVDFAQGFLREMGGSQHLIGQATIEVDGPQATGEVYFIAWHLQHDTDGDKDLIVAGRYVDRYEKRNGEWRIARREEVIDWARTDPVANGFLKDYAGQLLRGGRGADDISVSRYASA